MGLTKDKKKEAIGKHYNTFFKPTIERLPESVKLSQEVTLNKDEPVKCSVVISNDGTGTVSMCFNVQQ